MKCSILTYQCASALQWRWDEMEQESAGFQWSQWCIHQSHSYDEFLPHATSVCRGVCKDVYLHEHIND